MRARFCMSGGGQVATASDLTCIIVRAVLVEEETHAWIAAQTAKRDDSEGGSGGNSSVVQCFQKT